MHSVKSRLSLSESWALRISDLAVRRTSGIRFVNRLLHVSVLLSGTSKVFPDCLPCHRRQEVRVPAEVCRIDFTELTDAGSVFRILQLLFHFDPYLDAHIAQRAVTARSRVVDHLEGFERRLSAMLSHIALTGPGGMSKLLGCEGSKRCALVFVGKCINGGVDLQRAAMLNTGGGLIIVIKVVDVVDQAIDSAGLVSNEIECPAVRLLQSVRSILDAPIPAQVY